MRGSVSPVGYQPHDPGYRLAVEVVDAAALRARVRALDGRGFERIDFQCVLFVRAGSYDHVVDFQHQRCTAGSCLLIGPGQVHRFGPPSDWDGWLLILRSEQIPDSVARLPTHVHAGEELAATIGELLERMAADALSDADPTALSELLALQALVLVRRLALGHAGTEAASPAEPVLLRWFRQYRSAVEQEFRRWHLVSDYARHLGCAAKTLNRASLAVSAVTAKRVIIERIILEARRTLAHSSDSVATISTDLGFNEPTNFVKFFRRETGLTPAVFRANVRHSF